MFTDPIFRIALILSLTAHVAILGPRMSSFFDKKETEVKVVDLNYVIIKAPKLAEHEKIDSDSTGQKEESHQDDEAYLGEVPLMSEKVDTGETDSERDISHAEKEESYLRYHNLLREKIRASLAQSVLAPPEGDLEIEFTLSPNGSFLRVEGISSNIAPRGRAEALKAIRRAGPFPQFPTELGRNPVTFHLTITFQG